MDQEVPMSNKVHNIFIKSSDHLFENLQKIPFFFEEIFLFFHVVFKIQIL